MDWWASFEALLRCQPGKEHLLLIVLGSVVSAATTIAAGYKLCRWIWPPPPKHQAAADALRDEGYQRAQVGDVRRAMRLYNLSIRLNPQAGYVYFLRGLLHERTGNLPKAIADWKRAVVKIPDYRPLLEKLAKYGSEQRIEVLSNRLAYVSCIGGALLLGSLIALWQFAFVS